jgi:hypothetical protein
LGTTPILAFFVFLKTVVGQVTEHILDLLQVKGTSTDLEICLAEDAHVEWFPAVDQDPLSEIELSPAIQTERLLYVLLHNLLLLLFGSVGDYLREVPSAVDAQPSGIVRWLHNPDVVGSVYLAILRQTSG